MKPGMKLPSKSPMQRIMKDMHLPSGLTDGSPMVLDAQWSIKQLPAVAELLQDLLHMIHSRYQGELYAYWRDTPSTALDVAGAGDEDQGVSF